MAENKTTGTATSRASSVRPAVRKATKARLAMSGASGSGKTWTALSIAEVLAPGGRYVHIDTEPSDDNNTAAELYSDRFSFDLIDWTNPPWDPRDLALTVRDLGSQPEPIDVLIIDSASAFWRKQGGTLDIAGGRFGGWRTATPAQDDLIDAILRAPFHVIVCTRAKQAYEVEEGNDKKQTVKKLGLEPIQRDDMEYEFQVVAMIDGDHRIDIGKTRCADLAGLSFPANKQGDLARIYSDWLGKGLTLVTQTDADLLTGGMNIIDDPEHRQTVKGAFLTKFGKPTEMDVDKLNEAWEWVAKEAGVPDHPFVPSEVESSECMHCTLGRRAKWHRADAPPVEAPPDEAASTEGGDEVPEGS